MTIAEFSRDWAPTIAAIAACLGLVSIVLVWYQIRRTNNWNRVSAAFSLMDLDRFYLLEEQATKDCKALGIPFPHELSPEQATAVRSNYNAYHSVKNLATFLERICVAYQAGYADKDVVSSTYGPLLVGYCGLLEHYIAAARKDTSSPEAYSDFGRTAKSVNEWLQRKRLAVQYHPDGDSVGGVPRKL
jgi:hypothetical protein